MAEQPLENEAPASSSPARKSWGLKLLIWALVGLAVGALWVFFHGGSGEEAGQSTLPIVGGFMLVGLLLSLFIGKACRT